MAGSTSYFFLIILGFCLSDTQGFTNGNLRLVGNSGQTGGSSGRLEVYYSGQWGTVCNDRFDINDARVACRQLGYSTYTRYGTVGRLGFSQASSSTRTWLDNLRCSGAETKLTDCPANTIGAGDCTHTQDVALICTTSDGGGGSNIPAYSGGGVGSFISGCIIIFCCIFCCRRLLRSDSCSSTTTTVYTAPPQVRTKIVYRSPPKEDPPPRYTGRSVATTEASNRSLTALRVVERFQGPNGLVCQKEQTAIRYI